MRGLLSHLEVGVPATVEEAVTCLGDGRTWLPMAGATDVGVWLNAGRDLAGPVLSLHRLRPELRYVSVENDRLRVGALATFRDLARSEGLRARVPMLAEAARTIGAAAIQNRATVGGNIANASPAGDSLPVWLALGATVELRSAAGVRRVPFDTLFVEYRRIDRRPDELLTAVQAPLPPGRARQYFRKVGTRRAQAISKVVLAGLLETDRGRVRSVRIALGSVAPVPVRARRTEALLTGAKLDAALVREAANTLRAEIRPIDDVRSTAAYRLSVAGNLLAEFLAPA